MRSLKNSHLFGYLLRLRNKSISKEFYGNCFDLNRHKSVVCPADFRTLSVEYSRPVKYEPDLI